MSVPGGGTPGHCCHWGPGGAGRDPNSLGVALWDVPLLQPLCWGEGAELGCVGSLRSVPEACVFLAVCSAPNPSLLTAGGSASAASRGGGSWCLWGVLHLARLKESSEALLKGIIRGVPRSSALRGAVRAQQRRARGWCSTKRRQEEAWGPVAGGAGRLWGSPGAGLGQMEVVGVVVLLLGAGGAALGLFRSRGGRWVPAGVAVVCWAGLGLQDLVQLRRHLLRSRRGHGEGAGVPLQDSGCPCGPGRD